MTRALYVAGYVLGIVATTALLAVLAAMVAGAAS